MIAPSPPGRPRSFDETRALRRALDAFRAHGYRGASYPVLEAATGLRRQSLRYAFGDKADLFRRALAAYVAEHDAAMLAALDGPGEGLRPVETAFAAWRRLACEAGERGCLIVNTRAEGPEARGAAAAALDAATETLRAAFARAFARAARAGALRPGLDPEALAAQAVALGDGLLLHARGGPLRGAAGPALDAFLAQIRA
jgi:TetR/AcrR family transcriptional repressor of nem operon